MWLNYGEMYCVSEDGLVMNRNTGRILSLSINKDGYLRVKIYDKSANLHQIVAQMFCPKIDLPDLEVDHINQDTTDSRASNLRWVDKSTNCRNRGNPTNIHKNHSGYCVKFMIKRKYIYQKWFQTLEEATAARDAFKNSPEYLSA